MEKVRLYFIQLPAIVALFSYFTGSKKLTGLEKKTHKLYVLAESALIQAKTITVLVLYAI